jgi:hypothetical protein
VTAKYVILLVNNPLTPDNFTHQSGRQPIYRFEFVTNTTIVYIFQYMISFNTIYKLMF